MNIKRLIGLDILADRYAYARDEQTGYTSAQRIPEKWIATTCGYCSVGCGMEIGIRDGKAVAARPLDSHPVNRGKLCPKGLSEHHTIDTPDRARQPLLRKDGKLIPISWDEALDTMVERFRATQARHGRNSLGVISTGQLVTEEFYALGKLVQLGFGTNNYDGNTTLCMSSAGRTVEHWHTGTKTRQVAILERLSPCTWLEMNPRDAGCLGLRSHDRVDLVSRRGRVRGVELRLTEITAPGQVFMPFHYFESNVNEVTQSAFDPVSREPNYKQCAVRVERSGANS